MQVANGLRRSRPWIASLALVATLAAFGSWAWWRVHRDPTPLATAEQALAAGNLDAAARILRAFLSSNPHDGQARLLYSRFLRLSGQPAKADRELRRAFDEGVPETELRREYLLGLAPTDFPRAEAGLREVLATRADDLEVLRSLADGLAQRGSFSEAAKLYGRWRKLAPDDLEPLTRMVRALVQDYRSSEAEVELKRVLAAQPDNFEARLLLGDCLLDDARTAEAEPELTTCARQRPDRFEPLIGLAACALERGNLDDARLRLDRALALNPSSVLALSYRGEVALRQRRLEPAADDFRRVVALEPNNLRGHLKLSQIYRRLGDEPRAKEHVQIFQNLDRELLKAAQRKLAGPNPNRGPPTESHETSGF